MGKHAFLILAHEDEQQLSKLLRVLDDERCEAFLHIDAKPSFNGASLCMSQSRLHVLSNRIDCRWGDYSLVEAELALISEAMKEGDYSYLHLISGMDYPLHCVDHIIEWCELHKGKELIGFSRHLKKNEIEWRTGRWFLFNRDFQSKSVVKRVLRKIHAQIQSLPGLGRKTDAVIKKGPQWCSFTSEFAAYVLSKADWIKHTFQGTYCPDELVMQTLAWNSRFRSRLFDTGDEFHGCMRYIPWSNGCLKAFTKEDFRAMKESDAFFGRKFTMEDIDAYERL